jgi:LacI family transcriptional regulator
VAPGLTAEQATAAAAEAKATGIGGVFLLPSRAADEAAADAAFAAGCRAVGLPLVLLERDLRGHSGPPAADLVAMDDTAAAAALTRHLFSVGRKRVAVVVASPTTSHNDRVAGYLYAVHTARDGKKEPAEVVIRLPEEKPTAGVSAYLADRVAKDKLDGLVCYQDYIAVGAIVELLNRGVRVPADVGVCGFDNIDVGALLPAGLTTYDLPAEAMADHAVRLMRDRIAEPDRPFVRVVVPGRLIVRGSTVAAV